MGESLSGSVAEIRTWDSYVSMSKFKQHVLNYHSVVGGSVTAGVNDLIYRFRLELIRGAPAPVGFCVSSSFLIGFLEVILSTSLSNSSRSTAP